MSYSFQVRGASIVVALAAAAAAFDEVVASQPTHAADKAPALAAAEALAALIHPDDTKDVVIAMNGYLSWKYPNHTMEGTPEFSGVACTVSVNQAARQ